MSSLLETPPNRAPEKKENYRFRTNSTACEWGESYHPGGYHPVHLQDVFNTQYRVIRKLGYGSYSTVWLAIDLRFVVSRLLCLCLFGSLIRSLLSSSSHYVALKIGIATSDRQIMSREILLYDCVAKPSVDAAGSRYIASSLDWFHHHGPNGKHLCLVSEALGPNVSTMLRMSPQCQIGEPWERRFPKEWVRRILRDVLLGLQFLHANSIVHGDLHLGNILFTVRLSDIKSSLPESLQQYPDQGTPLRRLDGKVDPWAPQYLLEPKSLYDCTWFELDPLVKIVDLGTGKDYCIIYLL